MAMMSQSDVRAGAMRYYELLRQGTPAADAFRQAFPNGLPTAEERAREAAKAQAKAQQKGGLASIGGLAAGALGVKAVSDAVAGKPILGGVVDKITGWFGGEAANDLELVRGAIQAIEPGMAVREGEQAAVASSQSIPDEWKGALNKALNGGTGLSEDVRQGILRIAARRYSEYRDAFNQKHGAYAGLASGSRIDPQRVLLRDLAEDVGTIYPDYDKSLQAAQQAAGQPTPPPVMTFEEFRKQKQAQRNNGLF